MRTLWLNLSARCLSWFTGRFNHPTPSDSTPYSRLWCIPTQCAALPFLSGLSPLRSPLLHNPGVHAGALGFNPMLLPKLDRLEIPRSRDRGNSYRSNPGFPSIRASGSCLRLCRVVFACYAPTGGSRPTPAGAGHGKYFIPLVFEYCTFVNNRVLYFLGETTQQGAPWSFCDTTRYSFLSSWNERS